MYTPEKGGRKPASKQMLRRRFFFALYALCVASESCAPQRPLTVEMSLRKKNKNNETE